MLTLEEIEKGFRHGEFFLEYLPTMSLPSEGCVGAEALVRWRRETGVVPPDEFIPIIENTYLSGLVTYWVLESIGRDLGDWLRQQPNVHIGVNVPPEIIGRGGLEYAVGKAGLTDVRDKLIFEITERGLPDKQAVDAINRAVAEYGTRFAVDDVAGNGANLVVLTRCHIDTVKVDRHLVAAIGDGRPIPECIAALAGLLHATRLTVIAEGVETAEQLESLKSLGVQMVQGYYFSRPLSAPDFLAFHAERK